MDARLVRPFVYGDNHIVIVRPSRASMQPLYAVSYFGKLALRSDWFSLVVLGSFLSRG